jgi:pyrroline-5-carboxylate reductase
MAEAIVRGVIDSGVLAAEAIHVYDPLPERRDIFSGLGCHAYPEPAQAAGREFVLLAVKPQSLRQAMAEVKTFLSADAVLLSIVAGVSINSLANLVTPGLRLVRIMPNTPLLVGQGMTSLARGAGVGEADMRRATSLFAAAGQVVEVKESDLDAVTALSGSGPAYLFAFAEALEAAGQGLGLSPDLARQLTVQTLRGASEMLARGGEASELRERVTSRGGTTAAALAVFRERGLADLVQAALTASRDRSVELGREA